MLLFCTTILTILKWFVRFGSCASVADCVSVCTSVWPHAFNHAQARRGPNAWPTYHQWHAHVSAAVQSYVAPGPLLTASVWLTLTTPVLHRGPILLLHHRDNRSRPIDKAAMTTPVPFPVSGVSSGPSSFQGFFHSWDVCASYHHHIRP